MKARRALSRILVEVLLIVIVLAALAGAYFIYSMYAGSATTQFSAIVLDAYASGDKLVVNVKNTGAMAIKNAVATANGASLTLTAPSEVNIAPGMSGTLEFSGTFNAGQQYTIILTLQDDASSPKQSVNLVFKITAI